MLYILISCSFPKQSIIKMQTKQYSLNSHLNPNQAFLAFSFGVMTSVGKIRTFAPNQFLNYLFTLDHTQEQTKTSQSTHSPFTNDKLIRFPSDCVGYSTSELSLYMILRAYLLFFYSRSRSSRTVTTCSVWPSYCERVKVAPGTFPKYEGYCGEEDWPVERK